MIPDTQNLDFTYNLVRPLFHKTFGEGSKNEILKLFEQLRKNIKLNKSKETESLSPQEKHQLLQQKKRDFYDGLLQDLIKEKLFALAQVVYSEKMREKFEVTTSDNILGMRIFAAQKNLTEFTDIFNKVIIAAEQEGENAQKLDLNMCENIAQDLMEFDTEKEKMTRLDMTQKLNKRVINFDVELSGKLLDSLAYIYTESQQWRLTIDLLSHLNTTKKGSPDFKTLNYLKKNLLYCFDPNSRG